MTLSQLWESVLLLIALVDARCSDNFAERVRQSKRKTHPFRVFSKIFHSIRFQTTKNIACPQTDTDNDDGGISQRFFSFCFIVKSKTQNQSIQSIRQVNGTCGLMHIQRVRLDFQSIERPFDGQRHRRRSQLFVQATKTFVPSPFSNRFPNKLSENRHFGIERFFVWGKKILIDWIFRRIVSATVCLSVRACAENWLTIRCVFCWLMPLQRVQMISTQNMSFSCHIVRHDTQVLLCFAPSTIRMMAVMRFVYHRFGSMTSVPEQSTDWNTAQHHAMIEMAIVWQSKKMKEKTDYFR